MKTMTKKMLTTIFTEAKEHKADICVEVTIPGQDSVEWIINSNRNIDNKLAYYLENYDEDLCLKRNKDVRIIRAFPLDFYLGEDYER